MGPPGNSTRDPWIKNNALKTAEIVTSPSYAIFLFFCLVRDPLNVPSLYPRRSRSTVSNTGIEGNTRLSQAWGEEANDCEVPLYWARLEYNRMSDPKQGKEIFEEIFSKFYL